MTRIRVNLPQNRLSEVDSFMRETLSGLGIHKNDVALPLVGGARIDCVREKPHRNK